MADAKEITVNGVVVSVPQPYDEGHQINQAEARALNQAYAEAIGNNKRAEIKKMLEESGGDTAAVQSTVQSLVSEYAKDYEFTLASVGAGSAKLDPLTKECRAIAKDYITGKLKEKGYTQKQYLEEHGEDAIKNKVMELADNEQIVKLAKKRLKEREQMANLDEIAV